MSSTKPKRQRMSVVCTNCKKRRIKCDRQRPACNNCIESNVGEFCEYTQPHWITEPENDHQPQSQNSEVENLKSRIQQLESLILKKNAADKNDEFIDFYSLYTAHEVKRSATLFHRPLSTAALYKKDQYCCLIQSYFSQCKEQIKHYKATRGVANSLFQALTLENTMSSSSAILERFSKEKRHPPMSTFTNVEDLISKIEKVLPSWNVYQKYMHIFWININPFFDVLDRDEFEERISKILIQKGDRIIVQRDDPEDIDGDVYYPVAIACALVAMRFARISLEVTQTVENDLSDDLIAVAQLCTSKFRFFRRTKFEMVQALLMLRLYYVYAPEDGDGVDMNQSQIMSSLILQSCIFLGMDRTRIPMEQKCMLALWNMDAKVCCFTGGPPIYQQLPDIHDDLITIRRLVKDISNRINQPVCDIAELLDALQALESMIRSKCRPNSTNDQFKKVIRLEARMSSLLMILMCHHALVAHYELTNPNAGKFKHHFMKMMSLLGEISDTCSQYLCNLLRVEKNYKFFLNRTVQLCIERCCIILTSLSLRIIHGNSHPELLNAVLEVFNQSALLLYNELGFKYYECFKRLGTLRFFYRVISHHRFNLFEAMLDSKLFGKWYQETDLVTQRSIYNYDKRDNLVTTITDSEIMIIAEIMAQILPPSTSSGLPGDATQIHSTNFFESFDFFDMNDLDINISTFLGPSL